MNKDVEDAANRAVHDFLSYELAQAHSETARNACASADYRRTLAQIRERAAECRSQHEPLASILEECEAQNPRVAVLKAIRYVICGRVD